MVRKRSWVQTPVEALGLSGQSLRRNTGINGRAPAPENQKGAEPPIGWGVSLLPDGRVDIHHVVERIDAALRKLKAEIPQPNQGHILRLKNSLESQGISQLRVLKYLQILGHVSRLLRHQDFKKVRKRDMEALLQQIENSPYKPWTKQGYKVIIKRFWKWLNGQDERYPPEVSWIKTRIKDSDEKLPEELFSEAEVRALIEAAEYPRDKAYVAMLFDAGCRPGELLPLKIKHIEFDQYGAHVTFPQGKTGMRTDRLIYSVPYVAAWLAQHPTKKRDDYLWVSIRGANKGQLAEYATMLRRLKKIMEASGLNKRIQNYIFRHSRVTNLSSDLTEPLQRIKFGWSKRSKQPARYQHLRSADLDKKLLKLHGIKTEEDRQNKKSPLAPIPCPRCAFSNPCTADQCTRCGMVLSIEKLVQLDKQKSEAERLLLDFLKVPEVRAAIEAEARKRLTTPRP